MSTPAPPLPTDQLDCAVLCAEEALAALRQARAHNLAGNRNAAIGALVLAEQPVATAEILVSALLIIHRTPRSAKPS